MPQSFMNKIKFSVGVCAYNEEQNIGQLLDSILKQKLPQNIVLQEIIVVASGCTDNTEMIVKDWQEKDKRIILISEKQRRGKSAAVNKFIKNAKTRYLVLSSADLLLEKKCLSILLSALSRRKIGLVSPQIVPINKANSLIGFAVNLLWELHHRINLQFPDRPKVGELIAFKKIFERIPPSSAVDEANIEPLIHFQDYEVRYCPNAIVYNKGPENIRDFLRQRRRIYAGHMALSKKYGYRVVTQSNFRILGVWLANLKLDPRSLFFTFIVILLEAVGRIIGFLDYKFNIRNHRVWKIAKTTKKMS